jgi:hypothetical protein
MIGTSIPNRPEGLRFGQQHLELTDFRERLTWN